MCADMIGHAPRNAVSMPLRLLRLNSCKLSGSRYSSVQGRIAVASGHVGVVSARLGPAYRPRDCQVIVRRSSHAVSDAGPSVSNQAIV